MSYDENLAQRIRELLAGRSGVTEKAMFGGIAFMVNGNMACGPNKDVLIVRVGKDAYEETLEHEGAEPMTFTGRPMRGFVEVSLDFLDSDDELADWVGRGFDFASSLPAK
ncbi:MAG: TfoX/Sxy family protein [Thermoleophilaceae bacterium]|nr:TfoX/Sxy family protein [Thermoleophilaceae bacterium]